MNRKKEKNRNTVDSREVYSLAAIAEQEHPTRHSNTLSSLIYRLSSVMSELRLRLESSSLIQSECYQQLLQRNTVWLSHANCSPALRSAEYRHLVAQPTALLLGSGRSNITIQLAGEP